MNRNILTWNVTFTLNNSFQHFKIKERMHFDNTFKILAWLWNINYNHKIHFMIYVKKIKLTLVNWMVLTCLLAPDLFCWCWREADIIQDTPVWSHPFLFAAHVSLPPTLTGVASEATLGPWARRSWRPPAGRAWPGPRPLRLRLWRPQLWLLVANKPDPHQAGDPDTTSKRPAAALVQGTHACQCFQVSSLTSSPDSSPSPGMMSGNVSIQSGHLSSPQQQSVTPIQLQQQQQQLQQQQQQQAQLQQQQQQQPDPTKSIQWQISTSSSSGGPAHPQNVNKVGPVASAAEKVTSTVCVNKWKGLILSGNFFL